MQTNESAMRFAYRTIYLTHDDAPEDLRLWSCATPQAQGKAAREVHIEHGGTCPEWAIEGARR